MSPNQVLTKKERSMRQDDDLLNPRNSDSPFNLRNPHSPFYDPQKAWKQNGSLPITDYGSGGLLLVVLTVGLPLVWFQNWTGFSGHTILFFVLLVVGVLKVVFGRGD
jgi:hypothetical protein